MNGLEKWNSLYAALDSLREGLDGLRAELQEQEADKRDLKASLEQQVMDMAKEADNARQKLMQKIIPLYTDWEDFDPTA